MLKRIVFFLVVACALGGLLVASQWRHAPLHVSGFIEADEIRLGSRVGGRVAKVCVEEGDQVKSGQVLIELEPFDLQQREAEAQAMLAEREAEYDELRKGFRPEEIAQAEEHYEQLKANYERLKAGPRRQEIEAGRARVDVAQAQLKLAQQAHRRVRELFDRNATTRDAIDEAIAQLEEAQGILQVRQKELDLLVEGTRKEEVAAAAAQMEGAKAAWELKKTGYRAEEIQQAKARCDAARASLDIVRRQLGELEITASCNGTIESLDLQPGDLVASGAPVLSMINHAKLWVRAYLPENLFLHIGEPVRVTVDAFPDTSFKAEVRFIARQAEFTPSNVQTPEERSKQVFRFKATLQEGLDRLRPGMAADVWLDASRDSQ